MTSDPIKNQVDEEFIDQLNKLNIYASDLIQNYVKKLVQHEVDVITDSDWFTEKIQNAVEDSTND